MMKEQKTLAYQINKVLLNQSKKNKEKEEDANLIEHVIDVDH